MKESVDKNKLTHKQSEFFMLVFILIFFIIMSAFFYKRHVNSYEYHRIFLQDVDGLIVGSPVRMMGIQIGYVKKVKIIGDEVYVKFVITDKSVKVPQGTTATVEFSGMAGSKSLELYPPTGKVDKQNTPELIVESPKRLHDSMALVNVMYTKITDIIDKSAHFGKQLLSAEKDIKNNKEKYLQKEDVDEFVETSNRHIEKIKEVFNKIKRSKK
ncbi:MCE family protein [bacterium]|nr:MCE family protein [bacterium]